MQRFKVIVCDDEGHKVYAKYIKAKDKKAAEDYAFKWSAEVEATESFFTTWMVEEAG